MKTISTPPQPATATLPRQENIEDLRARREALREEILKAPDWRQGTDWHTDRVTEIHNLTRRIQAMEDAMPEAGSTPPLSLDAFCRRHKVKPESVTHCIIGSLLEDAATDKTLARDLAKQARAFEESSMGRKNTIPVTLKLPAQAYDLIAAMASDEGCKEVADCILSLLITAAAAWCEKYRDEDELEDLFRPSQKEAA